MWNIEIPRDGHSRPLFSSAATRSIYSTQPKSNIQILLVYAVVRPYSCLWVDGRSVKAKPVCIWVKRINSLLPHRAFKTRKRHDREITTINNKPTEERNVHKTTIGRDRGQKPSKSTNIHEKPVLNLMSGRVQNNRPKISQIRIKDQTVIIGQI